MARKGSKKRKKARARKGGATTVTKIGNHVCVHKKSIAKSKRNRQNAERCWIPR